MKRIAIFCDGTWNRADAETPTNVVLLAQAMKLTAADGTKQVPFYIQGVGTGRGVTKWTRFKDMVLGGGLGWGLLANIEEAFRNLVFAYEPGDEVYIFGFSRGAYTARSLTGLIRSSGIPDRANVRRIPEAIARYRVHDDETTHPNSDESHEFRRELSPQVATSGAELDWRECRGLHQGHLLRISYLGVWDSVGALGIPNHLSIAPWVNRGKYKFHDAKLSSMVASARHAVALDEKRKSFEPTQWDNVDDLNLAHGGGSATPYEEKWFAGDHGSVGGGGDVTALSSIALEWIAEGAINAGLEFDRALLNEHVGRQDLYGPLMNSSQPPTGFVNRLTRWNPAYRDGPKRIEDLHPSVLQRWHAESKQEGWQPYRPGSLKRLETELDARKIGNEMRAESEAA